MGQVVGHHGQTNVNFVSDDIVVMGNLASHHDGVRERIAYQEKLMRGLPDSPRSAVLRLRR